ncbi:hypothetical protein ACGFYU_05800 [Streptomyces sp. NPDC048337]|uniref:hypothetical protein n=1 Tax=Streptomyces sp. NPDC048337 TaxID=3365535 RepID=UPI00371C642D
MAAGPERARLLAVGFFSPRDAWGPAEPAMSPMSFGLLAHSTLPRTASINSTAPVGAAAGSAFSTVSPAAFDFTRVSTFSRKASGS